MFKKILIPLISLFYISSPAAAQFSGKLSVDPRAVIKIKIGEEAPAPANRYQASNGKRYIKEELRILREENDDLRYRVRQLERKHFHVTSPLANA